MTSGRRRSYRAWGLALATLREGEETDAARVNEARSAAFRMVQSAAKGGIETRIHFGPPKITVTGPAPSADKAPFRNDTHCASPSVEDIWSAIYGNRCRAQYETPKPTPRAGPTDEERRQVFRGDDGREFTRLYLGERELRHYLGLLCGICSKALNYGTWAWTERTAVGRYIHFSHEDCGPYRGQ